MGEYQYIAEKPQDKPNNCQAIVIHNKSQTKTGMVETLRLVSPFSHHLFTLNQCSYEVFTFRLSNGLPSVSKLVLITCV